MTISGIIKFADKNAPELHSAIRSLSENERDGLIHNGNSAESWENIGVTEGFDPGFIKDCRFFGIVVIGKISKKNSSQDGFHLPAGIYNSTIGNSIIKDNVTINALLYCNLYKIECGVILHNIGEMFTTENAHFGQGTRADSQYQWINLINENGGRAVLPFTGMTCADAYLWAKYREDNVLINRLKKITTATCDESVEAIGTIGSSAIIKNTRVITDCNIGESAIINGAELINNVTIRSTDSEHTQIGSGVQLQNAIIGYGNHIDSGSQLMSVITGSAVSIHQTARISHSYIGDNSAIGCCEIAHSLIFPSHGQHHNNSFLIAAMIGGQSNIAAGATIGSNHNSRTNDGELWASRGFWPGLCTSFKHNSRFASYTMCVKADYPSELYIPFPFSLILNDTPSNTLVIIPAYWFSHNMYSFIRSKSKFTKRDKRIIREQHIEHNPLAPDTIEEIFAAITILECEAGARWYVSQKQELPDSAECCRKGKILFETHAQIPDLQIQNRFEKGTRTTLIKNPSQSWQTYISIIQWYAATVIIDHTTRTGIDFPEAVLPVRKQKWINCGGQIINHDDLTTLLCDIKSDSQIRTWDTIHEHFNKLNKNYDNDKYIHALGCLAAIEGAVEKSFTINDLKTALHKVIPVCKKVIELACQSRLKDYTDYYRVLVYDTNEEMNAVLGKFEDDTVIAAISEESKVLIDKILSFGTDNRA
jgi:hypothetical protein